MPSERRRTLPKKVGGGRKDYQRSQKKKKRRREWTRRKCVEQISLKIEEEKQLLKSPYERTPAQKRQDREEEDDGNRSVIRPRVETLYNRRIGGRNIPSLDTILSRI